MFVDVHGCSCSWYCFVLASPRSLMFCCQASSHCFQWHLAFRPLSLEAWQLGRKARNAAHQKHWSHGPRELHCTGSLMPQHASSKATTWYKTHKVVAKQYANAESSKFPPLSWSCPARFFGKYESCAVTRFGQIGAMCKYTWILLSGTWIPKIQQQIARWVRFPSPFHSGGCNVVALLNCKALLKCKACLC